MKLLLDTHTFIWWDSEPARLSAGALGGPPRSGQYGMAQRR